VASRSEGEARTVDLASCTCSCPNARPFCSHLYAAVQAAGSGGIRGRAGLLCVLRHRSRGRRRTPGEACAVAEQAVLELGAAVPHEMLAEWALDAFLRLRGGSDGGEGSRLPVGPRAEQRQVAGQRRDAACQGEDDAPLHAPGRPPGTGRPDASLGLGSGLPPAQRALSAVEAVLHLLWGL